MKKDNYVSISYERYMKKMLFLTVFNGFLHFDKFSNFLKIFVDKKRIP